MRRHTMSQIIGCALVLLLAAALPSVAQDQGFDVIYEGVVDEGGGPESKLLNFAAYGLAGYSASGALWASVGVRGGFASGPTEIDVDVSYGTEGLHAEGGASTEILGFGVGGRVTWSPKAPLIVDLRGWGTLDPFRFTASARLAGDDTAITLSGSTSLGEFGLSATLGLADGRLDQASAGVNTELGALAVSGSVGLGAGGFNVGGSVGLNVGPVDLIANAGYDATVGLNATIGGNVGWKAIEFSIVGMYDNTGLGVELLGRVALETTTLGFTGRFSGGVLNAEINGSLQLGSATVSLSLALDTQNGFAWAEAGFEVPF